MPYKSGRKPAARRRHVNKRSKRFVSRPKFNPGQAPLVTCRTAGTGIATLPATVLRNPFPRFNSKSFPTSIPFSTKWVDSETNLASTTGGTYGAPVIYRLNSLFAPRLSSGGASGPPEWYTGVLNNIYRRYMVEEVEVLVEAYKPATSTVIVGVLLQNSGGTDDPSGDTDYFTADKRTYQTMPLTATTGVGSYECMAFRAKLWEVEGITKAQYMAQFPIYGADVSVSPNTPLYLRVGASDRDGNASASACKVQVSITFKGRMWMRYQST